MDTLLEKDIPDRAFVVSDIGKKGGKSIERRIAEYRKSESYVGSHPKGRSKADCR